MLSNLRPPLRKQSIVNGSRETKISQNDCTLSEPEKDFVVLEISAAGFEFRIRAPATWTCAHILYATETEYRRQFPNCEVPASNVIYNWATAAHLEMNHPIAQFCSDYDKIELGFAATESNNEYCQVVEPHSLPPTNMKSALSGSQHIEDNAYFDIIFHRLPLGFTLKYEDDGVLVANTYPNTAAMHYQRLVSGVKLIKIGEVGVEESDLRQVHELIKHTDFPIKIRFQDSSNFSGMKDRTEDNNKLFSNQADYREKNKRSMLVMPTSHPGQAPDANIKFSFSSKTQDDNSMRYGATSRRNNDKGLADRIIRDSQRRNSTSNESMLRNGHCNSEKTSLQGRNPHVQKVVRSLCETDGERAEGNSEEYIICRIKTLQKDLIKKHEEAKQIALQLELYHERLTNLRKTAESIEFETPEVPKLNGSIKLQLTSEALDHLDKSAGLPPKSGARHNHDNVSNISENSKNSCVSGKGRNSRYQRRSRRMTREDDESQCSSASSRKSNSRQSTDSRYSYIPQHYSSAPTTYDYPTSLSSRGAVIDRARVNRDSFITRNDVPGVGYYDIKIKDRVKGGEIGDSDRVLPWSNT